jgi:hypothetical protein
LSIGPEIHEICKILLLGIGTGMGTHAIIYLPIQTPAACFGSAGWPI